MSGGGKSKEVVVGYKYKLGVHLLLGYGPVDKISELIFGERTGWTGNQTTSGTITVDKPELFGGDKREGGVAGSVDVLMGESTQPRNSYLSTHQGANCPAYRGIATLLFKSFTWASGNPYFKPPWVRATRILQGWSTPVWNSTRATINSVDMNPAHIIYQCLTDIRWGMGYNINDIDTTSFTAAAQTLFDEGFGLSLQWEQQDTIESFIKSIIDHINAALGLDLATGKFVLKLIRGDYDVEDLLLLNEDNIVELKSFQRGAYGDSANTLTVNYRDRDGNDKPITVQDLAAITAQGGEVATTRSYPGIRDAELASRVALRDLATLSSNLAKMVLTTNRVLYNKVEGDVVAVSWPALEIELVAFRIVRISKGTLLDSRIEVELVEDVFGLPSASYTEAPDSEWVDTTTDPAPVEAARAIEIPYWELVRNVPEANMATWTPGYGFGMVLATRGFFEHPFNFELMYAASSGGSYTDVGTGHFSPTGLLQANITHTQTSIQLVNFYDLDQVRLDNPDLGYLLVDNEFMAVTAVNPSTGVITVRRGVLDSVPATHNLGARVYFVPAAYGADSTERASGETAYYKPLPTTGLGTLPVAAATPVSVTMSNRATRPYPPGRFQINAQYYPVEIIDAPLTVSWAHRDRLSQTVSLVDYTAANIGPEVGTTYTLRISNADTTTVLQTYTGLTGTSQALPVLTMDGNLRIELWSVRGGIDSAQKHDFTFHYFNVTFRLTESGDNRITESGDTRITE